MLLGYFDGGYQDAPATQPEAMVADTRFELIFTAGSWLPTLSVDVKASI